MEPSNVSSEQTARTLNAKGTSPTSLHEQRTLETRRILKQTHWTFDRFLKTLVDQNRHERHKIQAKQVLDDVHKRTNKKRSSNKRSTSDPMKNAPKSNDEQESANEMEQAVEEEPQVSANMDKEACNSHLGLSSTCRTALHDDDTQHLLSTRISEVRQGVRAALIFGKRCLNGERKLCKAELISIDEDHNSETKENEIPLLLATAQYNECRFQDYNKQIDEELKQWLKQHDINAHKTSSNAFVGREENGQTAGETYEDLREHEIDDVSKGALAEDDSWMDEYRNPLFNEYNVAPALPLQQELDSHSNNTHNMSKEGVHLQVDDSHDSNIQSVNSSCGQELQETRDSEPRLDSNEAGCVFLETGQTMSISRIKFLQDLMLTAMEQFHKERHFKATPVPLSTSQPRYDNLVMEQDLRRFINKHEAMELLQQLQKPFSFNSKSHHSRSQTPVNKAPNKKPLFIAKEVPSHVKQMRYTLLLEQDALRKVELQKQAKLKLESAKMPPRMELHQKRSQETTSTQDQPEEEKETRSPGFIPDFKNLHSQWKQRLQRSRESNQRKLTVPLAFNMERRPNRHSSFHQSSKSPTPEPRVPNKRPSSNTGLRNFSPKSSLNLIQKKKAVHTVTAQQMDNSKKNTKMNKLKRSKVTNIETQTPSQYINARYKQIEKQAKEIVAEVLKAQGLDFHKYITF